MAVLCQTNSLFQSMHLSLCQQFQRYHKTPEVNFYKEYRHIPSKFFFTKSLNYFFTHDLVETRFQSLPLSKSCKNRFSNNLTCSVLFMMYNSFSASHFVLKLSIKLYGKTYRSYYLFYEHLVCKQVRRSGYKRHQIYI